ncbi:CoA transferase [Paraburkholderia sp. RL18-103-BIB-C]|jgi:crotonobetainyl-CoA:carnitine CoA-transferase CaiB-like acyl-CoA transferase|uniref:CaiB/BaiF CoA-transferase family protein n=1 Tax=unclassified Paraburkholderia TaxID=2615204 RepID=UPI002F45AD6D
MLDGVRILAWGTHTAVRLSATLLERAGAHVDVSDAQRIDAFAYDAVVVSSDFSSGAQRSFIAALKAAGNHLVCDITATGPQASRAGVQWSDAQIQAMTGLMDTTGFANGQPVRIGVPFTEISAAMYAAAALAAALRVVALRGIRQHIDVTLFGCAASALTTFLPAAFARGQAGRVGNRHPACAPWNAFRTRDGWILICTSTEEQWRKLKGVAGIAQLDDARFASLAGRVRHVDALDALIEAWTTTLSTEACSRLCERIGVAAGPIVGIGQLPREPNFRMRHAGAAVRMETHGVDANSYRDVPVFRAAPLSGVASALEPLPHAVTGDDAGPLAGVKVIEIGQYTTAPLVGKHLAALGAQVVKIEPPDGEVARAWTPGQGGTSYFFALNNTDKQTLALDLKHEKDRAYLRTLLADADVLVENLRPGALAKLGFDRTALAEINPRLIYCSISGFGMESAYPSRPAFDTVIQAMGGLMDLTRSDGVPVKFGASGADILGGQAALLAIVASLASRAGGAGTFIEISMQDVAAWCSLFATGNPEAEGRAVRCSDGHVWVEGGAPDGDAKFGVLTRQRAVASLGAQGVRVVPVTRVHELLDDADFLADVQSVARDPGGAFWPVLKVPYRLSRTPARVRAVPGAPERLTGSEVPAIDAVAAHELHTD